MFKNHWIIVFFFVLFFLLQPIWTLSLQSSRGTRNPPPKIQDEEKTHRGTYRDAGGLRVNVHTVELQEPNTVNRFQSFLLCLFLSSRFDKLGANETAAVGEKRKKNGAKWGWRHLTLRPGLPRATQDSPPPAPLTSSGQNPQMCGLMYAVLSPPRSLPLQLGSFYVSHPSTAGL